MTTAAFRTAPAAGLLLGFGLLLATAGRAVAQQSTVTLEQAIKLAQQVQPSVVQAQTTVRSAGAQIRTAKGAFLPNLNATSSYGPSYSAGPARTNPVTGELVSGDSKVTSVSTGLSSSIDLFTGFRRGSDLKSAHATEDAAFAGLVDAKFQIALTTTQTFLSALSDRQLISVREAAVQRAEEQLKIAVAKLHAGTATRSDSLTSLVTLGTAQLQLIQAETDLATAEAGLGQLTGLGGRVAAVDDSAFYRMLAPLDTLELAQEAEAHSPRVQNSDALAKAAEASYSSSKAAYWPTLRLSANTTWNGSSTSDYQLFNQRQLNLSLNWPLFDRFVREQTIVTRGTALDVANANANDARRQVRAALISQLAALRAAALRIDISGNSVQAATENLRVQRERYRLGAATIVDVLVAQESLNQAEVDVVNARFDYLRAKAQIEALIGRSL